VSEPTSGDAAAPVFAEPWQAHAFAITLALHERGLFGWPEWADALAREIGASQTAGDPDDGSGYYRHWLAALEALVAVKGAATTRELERTRDAWIRAAARTAHGQPIELTPADFVDLG
jgi:nitrile hydratase accessory protein